MRVLFYVLVSLLLSSKRAFADQLVGSVRCEAFGDKIFQLEGRIYGEGQKFKYANFSFYFLDTITGKLHRQKSWSLVPFVDRGFAFSALFKAEGVELNAVFDDVGNMSTFSYQDMEVPMTCSFN